MSEKEMVCSRCFRAFLLASKTTWLSGERMPCPHCGSRDTTPMLKVSVDGRRLDTFTLINGNEARERILDGTL
jgi:DNA-directed RNA polymerase subunit RPC12/RpoP